MEVPQRKINKYQKIYKEIKGRILKNIYPINTKIPDEISLSKEFYSSRMTIKKALDLLVNEGLIYRKRGVGTYVMSHSEPNNKFIIPEKDISGLSTLSQKNNYKISSKIINFTIEFAPKEIQEALQVNEFEPVYNIYRLRLVNNKPYVIEHTYMSTNKIPGITEKILKGSIYNHIENTLSLKIHSAKKTLRADQSNEMDQKFLNLSSDEPVLEIHQIAYLNDGAPFEFSTSRHRYDLFEFSTYAVR